MFSDNRRTERPARPSLGEMERSLSTLAARWRSRQNTPEAEAVVHAFQSILRLMVELGYHDSLDVDAQLPDEYMPDEYLRLFD